MSFKLKIYEVAASDDGLVFSENKEPVMKATRVGEDHDTPGPGNEWDVTDIRQNKQTPLGLVSWKRSDRICFVAFDVGGTVGSIHESNVGYEWICNFPTKDGDQVSGTFRPRSDELESDSKGNHIKTFVVGGERFLDVPANFSLTQVCTVELFRQAIVNRRDQQGTDQSWSKTVSDMINSVFRGCVSPREN